MPAIDSISGYPGLGIATASPALHKTAKSQAYACDVELKIYRLSGFAGLSESSRTLSLRALSRRALSRRAICSESSFLAKSGPFGSAKYTLSRHDGASLCLVGFESFSCPTFMPAALRRADSTAIGFGCEIFTREENRNISCSEDYFADCFSAAK